MLYYPSRRRLPGSYDEITDIHRMANTIQQLYMCQGFAAAGEDVAYVSPQARETTLSWDVISEFYGLSTRFDLTAVPAFQQTYSFPNYPIPDSDDQSLFCWMLYMAALHKFSEGDVLYTRTLDPTRYFLELREKLNLGSEVSVWFEQHQVDRGVEENTVGKQFYQYLDGLVCISQRQKEKIVRTQSLDPEKILVAHDGVDLAAYANLTTAGARERLDFDPDERIVMYTGHLYPSKGVETLVQAASEFDAAVYIVGGYEEDISRIKAEEEIPANVTFTGFVSPSEIPLYQTAADILVATARPDPPEEYFSPLKLFEYMAAGKPMVVSRKPEFEEVLTDGENAILVTPSSRSELAEAIKRVFADSKLGTALGRQARQDAAQYDWERRAETILRKIRGKEPLSTTKDAQEQVG